MKKSVKILFTTLLVGLAVALTSCADLLDAVGGAVTEAASLQNETFDATVGGTYVALAFKVDSDTENSTYKMDVTIGENTYTNEYTWFLDNEDLEGERDVVIFRNGTEVGRLSPDALLPQVLTPTGSFPLGTFGTGAVIVSSSNHFNRR
ncbi:MAG: hypothetical protein J6Y16_10500 [Treponema sp.]|nr:hypothetical protein [Treponema sp.]